VAAALLSVLWSGSCHRICSGPEPVASSNLSSRLPITRAGDQARVSYLESADAEITLTAFANLSLGDK